MSAKRAVPAAAAAAPMKPRREMIWSVEPQKVLSDFMIHLPGRAEPRKRPDDGSQHRAAYAAPLAINN